MVIKTYIPWYGHYSPYNLYISLAISHLSSVKFTCHTRKVPTVCIPRPRQPGNPPGAGLGQHPTPFGVRPVPIPFLIWNLNRHL